MNLQLIFPYAFFFHSETQELSWNKVEKQSSQVLKSKLSFEIY